MENINDGQLDAESKRHIKKNSSKRHTIFLSILIVITLGAMAFICFLISNNKASMEAVTTMIVVTVFGFIFSVSLLDRLGI
jgi:hypothetical protein